MVRKLGTNKDVEKLARQARAIGIKVEVQKNGKIFWVAPNGDRYVSQQQVGDQRRIKQIFKFLKEHGLDS